MNPDALSDLVLLLVCAAILWFHLRQRPAVAVAAGLIIATAVKLARALKHNPLGMPASFALGAATLVMVGFLRWPMVWVVLGLGSLGMSLAAWRLSEQRLPGPSEELRP